jgi:histidine triad (HIT) family protein
MAANQYPVAPDCIFCKIIAGEIPCARVYEDVDILAFLDINPIARGHTLVLPKGHYPTLLDLPAVVGTPLMRALRLVASGVKQATESSGFNCIQNNFSSAGQMVFHSHWHIIPRYDNDGLPDWPGGRYADSAEMQQLAFSINSRLRDGAGDSHE